MQRRNNTPHILKDRRFSTSWRIAAITTLSILMIAGAVSWGVISLRSATPRAQAASSSPPPMGINLTNPGDSDGDFLFADAFKTWRLEAAPGQSSAPSLDSAGWPQGDFGAFLWDGGFLVHTSGTYGLRFNGSATVQLGLVGGSVSNQNYDASTNTTTATVTISSDSSAQLNFTNTKRTSSSATNTGVTNIQLMRPTSPGASSSYSFSTTFTDAIKNFVRKFQAIRFMDYSATNGNGQVNWSDRRLPQENQEGPPHNSNTYGWEGLGAAWEYAIQLSNETSVDAYINVPEQATDAYITQLANLIAYGSDANGNVYTSTQSSPVHPPLNRNLHLYIEFSNEVWNGGFSQMHQNHDSALAEVQAGGSPLNYDGETNEWVLSWRRIGKRIHDISNIFRSVFGDSAMPPNSNPMIRPILEWQYGNAQDTAHTELAFLNGYYNNGGGNFVSNPHPVNYFLYGGGGAAYSGPNNPGGSTVDAILNSGLNTTIGTAGIGTVAADVQWTKQYGLHDIAYEGGFQIGGDSPSALQNQAELDPRTKNLEIQTQNFFNQQGGELLMYFDSTSKNYGLAQPTVLDSTPKTQAIDALNNTTYNTPTPSATNTPTPSPTPSPTPGGSGGGSLPSPWQDKDIGSVGATGSASYSSGTFTVNGSGTDIWDTSDSFHYVYQSLNGDGSIVARVASEQNTNAWAKAGVMIRETLNTGSTHAFMAITPGSGSAFQNRTSTNASSNNTGGPNVTAPYWVKLVRSGSTFTGSVSSDGSTWTQVGSTTISMASSVYIGLAVTSHSNGTLNTSTFGNVSVNAGGGSGKLLASEGFSGSSGALNGQGGGSGWSGTWSVQNGDTSVPGYNASSGSLSYSTLQTSGNHAVGGASYLTAGRNLDTSSSGAFSSYLSSGQIGASGTTLWVSVLLRKDTNTDQEVSLTLHDNSLAWCTGCAKQKLALGYFGSNSNNGGTRYWSLSLNGTVTRSNVAVTVGQTALLVMRIDFSSNTTATLYVNPSSLGGSAPSSSSATANSGAASTFVSAAYYGGDGSGASSIDEIRFGTSYSSVTPSN